MEISRKEISRKYQESLENSWNTSLVPSLSAKMKVLLTLAKTSSKQKLKFSRIALFRIKTRVNVKYFVNDCLWKQSFASDSHQTSSNLFSLTILETLRPFTLFKPKIRAIKWQKRAKTCLTW